MRAKRFTLSLLLVIVAVSAFWYYRVKAVTEAAEFSPARGNAVLVPAGTPIHAVIRTGIPSLSRSGDTITAFVSTPVVFDGQVAIPSESEVTGTLEAFSPYDRHAEAHMRFTKLRIRGRTFDIQSKGLFLIIRTQTATESLGGAFRTLMGATLGMSLGAASGDRNMIEQGLIESEGTTITEKTAIPITVVLNRGLLL
jgi:hypothetical protein